MGAAQSPDHRGPAAQGRQDAGHAGHPRQGMEIRGQGFRSEDRGSRQDRGHRPRQGPYRGAHPGQDPALRFREPDLFRRRRVAEAFRTGPLRARLQRADQGHGETQRYRNAGVPCRSRGGACGFGRAQDLLGKPHHARPFQQGSVRSARRGGHGPRVQQGRNRPRHQGSARSHQVPRRPAARARLQEAAALPLPRQRVRLPPARRAGKRAEIR